MSKKYDIYIADGKANIYPRGEVAECGDLPEGKPLQVMGEDEDWYDWCSDDCGWKNMADDTIRVCRRVLSVNADYARDLEKAAQKIMDLYVREGKECGWGDLEIDRSGMTYTFRRSANWKDEPTLYTFGQRLSWSNQDGMDFGKQEHLWARDNLVRLHGMADAAHELGLDIVFDSDFKVHVMGASPSWEAKYEY